MLDFAPLPMFCETCLRQHRGTCRKKQKLLVRNTSSFLKVQGESDASGVVRGETGLQRWIVGKTSIISHRDSHRLSHKRGMLGSKLFAKFAKFVLVQQLELFSNFIFFLR